MSVTILTSTQAVRGILALALWFLTYPGRGHHGNGRRRFDSWDLLVRGCMPAHKNFELFLPTSRSVVNRYSLDKLFVQNWTWFFQDWTQFFSKMGRGFFPRSDVVFSRNGNSKIRHGFYFEIEREFFSRSDVEIGHQDPSRTSRSPRRQDLTSESRPKNIFIYVLRYKSYVYILVCPDNKRVLSTYIHTHTQTLTLVFTYTQPNAHICFRTQIHTTKLPHTYLYTTSGGRSLGKLVSSLRKRFGAWQQNASHDYLYVCIGICRGPVCKRDL